ncbi:MAG TPA: hypothetical protein VK459_14330, partial [Polyangiaceae bacterium]|nr:hypothetical protein [Polyangiaceae bacterium]
EEAEAKRRQMPSPGLMNETAVEIEMRKQMRERVAARIAGLGEDFRNTARESVERMLTEMFVKASYETGRLEVLLPPGKALIERIDALGRSGHVSESVVRYQNHEMAKADVAFEVLSRYFARQIVDILDATDPGDRDIREREMQGLEQFFGMGIADKAQATGTGVAGTASGMLGSVKAKLGFGAEEGQQQQQPQQQQPSIGGFPSTGQALPFPSGTTRPSGTEPGRSTGSPQQPQPGQQLPQPQGQPQQPAQAGQRDWSKMLARVRTDVDRICSFLEALAKHPRGLQKYHEETVRTVLDSWLDREGEQSLRRWVRSECARIWPHKFAAIEAEKERALADIEALEELFGSRSAEPARAPGAAAGASEAAKG